MSKGNSNLDKFALQKPTMTLEQELREIWAKPVDKLPVNKDLPRLAGRIHVVFNQNPVLSQIPEVPPQRSEKAQPASDGVVQKSIRLHKNVDYRLSEIMKESPVADTFRFKEDLQKDRGALTKIPWKYDENQEAEALQIFNVWITNRLPDAVYTTRRATDHWVRWDGPGFLTLKNPKNASRMVLELKFKDADVSLWTLPPSSLVHMLDSSRYFVVKNNDVVTGFAFHTREESSYFKEFLQTEQANEQKAQASGKAPAEAETVVLSKNILPIHRVVMAVASILEAKDIVTKYEQGFLLLNNTTGDLELALPDLWKGVGNDGKTIRVFKAIHQNIVFAAIFHLKQAMKSVLTKDVRTPEGWQIYIHVLPDVVVITHVRREQALETRPPEEFFWIEWQLRIIFDHNMTELRAARLRICDLGFGEKTTEAKKKEYNAMFGGGNLIFY